MNTEERQDAVKLLFGHMLEQLDELKEAGIAVPSEVYLYLGMLQGNMDGIVAHIAGHYDIEITRLKRRIKEDIAETCEEEEEEIPEPPPKPKLVSSRNVGTSND